MTRFAGGPKISNFLSDGPRFDRMGAAGVRNAAEDNANVALNNARTADAGMRAIVRVESAEANADVIRAGAPSAGTAAIGAAASGIGGLGGLFKRGGGGSGSSISGLGSFLAGSNMGSGWG